MAQRSSTRRSGTSGNGERPARGAVGQQTYEAVQGLIGQGKKATEAFATVAEQTGRSAATVATAYYRVARRTPDSGVKTRPRTRSAAAAPAKTPTAAGPRRRRESASTADELRALRRQTQQLLESIDGAITKVDQLEGDARAYREIQQVLSRS